MSQAPWPTSSCRYYLAALPSSAISSLLGPAWSESSESVSWSHRDLWIERRNCFLLWRVGLFPPTAPTMPRLHLHSPLPMGANNKKKRMRYREKSENTILIAQQIYFESHKWWWVCYVLNLLTQLQWPSFLQISKLLPCAGKQDGTLGYTSEENIVCGHSIVWRLPRT